MCYRTSTLSPETQQPQDWKLPRTEDCSETYTQSQGLTS